jgi:hypothetical protein
LAALWASRSLIACLGSDADTSAPQYFTNRPHSSHDAAALSAASRDEDLPVFGS